MKILSIETATQACSAALYIDGDVIEKFEVCHRLHTKKILYMVDSLLSEAGIELSQLDGIAFGKGPGSFTGVRLAVSIAQGLSFGSQVPLFPISTLAAVALGALKQTSQIDVALVAMDARMGEIYFGAYQVKVGKQQLTLMRDEILIGADQLSLSELQLGGLHVIGCGHGFDIFPDLAKKHDFIEVFPEILPHASEIAILAASACEKGLGLDPLACSAEYLRQDVVQSQKST